MEIVGIDSAPVAIALARQRAGGDPRLRFEVADLADPDLGAARALRSRDGPRRRVQLRAADGAGAGLPRDPIGARARTGNSSSTSSAGGTRRARSSSAATRRARSGSCGSSRSIRSRAAATSSASSSRPGPIQDSERNFYTAPEIRTLLELAGLEPRAVAGDLALAVPAREDAEPSFFFRARPR